MEDRKLELMSYLTLLTKLEESEFICNREMKEALEELHKEMGFGASNTYNVNVSAVKNVIPLEKLKNQVNSEEDSKLVSIHSKKDRGIGKTTILIELSKQKDIPILVGSQHKREVYLSTYPSVKVFVAGVNNPRGSTYANGILIDESVSLKQYADLLNMNVKIRGGFFETDKYFTF
jgi:hypothetical protein